MSRPMVIAVICVKYVFFFNLIYIIINHIFLLKQTHLFQHIFLEYLLLFLDDNVDEVDEENKSFLDSKSSA